jgi:hypothetical protein
MPLVFRIEETSSKVLVGQLLFRARIGFRVQKSEEQQNEESWLLDPLDCG